MVAVLGEKLFELVVLTLALAPLLPHEFAGLVELPHADPNSATTATTPIIARIRLLQGDETGFWGREPPAKSSLITLEQTDACDYRCRCSRCAVGVGVWKFDESRELVRQQRRQRQCQHNQLE